jgi:hypothetical protein
MGFIFPIGVRLEGSNRSAEKEAKASDNARSFRA